MRAKVRSGLFRTDACRMFLCFKTDRTFMVGMKPGKNLHYSIKRLHYSFFLNVLAFYCLFLRPFCALFALVNQNSVVKVNTDRLDRNKPIMRYEDL